MFNKLFFSLVFIFALFLQTSCKKEQPKDGLDVTDEIRKVETSFKEGDLKIEKGINGTEFIRNYTPKAYSDSIKTIIMGSYSKTKLKSAGVSVGVLKYGTCGPYRELQVYMDNEDNGNSQDYGWKGDSNIDSRGNANLFFCIVDGDYFQRRSDKPYAILKTDAIAPNSGVKLFKRYFDNEDTRNWQWIIYNGQFISAGYQIGYNSFGQNTWLWFYYYPSDIYSNTSMPNLGIPYGVFGTIVNADARGYIYCDDENRRNGNEAWYWDGYKWNDYQSGLPGVFDCNHDGTKLFISQIN